MYCHLSLKKKVKRLDCEMTADFREGSFLLSDHHSALTQTTARWDLSKETLVDEGKHGRVNRGDRTKDNT